MFSSYFTIYNAKIYAWRKKIFTPKEDYQKSYDHDAIDVLLFGYGRMGSHLAEVLEKNGLSYLVVDHNPAVISVLKEKNIPHVFGDATNDELYMEILSK